MSLRHCPLLLRTAMLCAAMATTRTALACHTAEETRYSGAKEETLATYLEDVVPVHVDSSREWVSYEGVLLRYDVWRLPFTLGVDSKSNVVGSVRLLVRGEAAISMFGHTTPVVSCGRDRPLTIDVTFHIALLRDGTRTSIDTIRSKPCRTVFGIDVARRLEQALKAELDRVAATLDEGR